MKKIGIRILGCMALLSMVGCGRIEGASVQDLSNTKDAIVESETTLAENNNEYSNKNSLFYSDISSYRYPIQWRILSGWSKRTKDVT